MQYLRLHARHDNFDENVIKARHFESLNVPKKSVKFVATSNVPAVNTQAAELHSLSHLCPESETHTPRVHAKFSSRHADKNLRVPKLKPSDRRSPSRYKSEALLARKPSPERGFIRTCGVTASREANHVTNLFRSPASKPKLVSE